MAVTTLKDIAKIAGVSVATVSLYLNGKPGVSQAAQQSIAAAVEQVGYTPRRAKKSARSNLIAILMETLSFPAFSDVLYLPLLQGFEGEARRLGYHTVINTIDRSATCQAPAVLTSGEFAGIAALGGGDLSDEFLRAISASGTPLVLVDNYLMDGSINAVISENEMGGYFVARHLLELGYNPIAVISGPSKYKTLTDRLLGFLRAMLESEARLERWQIQPYLSSGSSRKGYLEMTALLSQPTPPRGVFCISDRAAFGALAAVEEAGLRVPQDIALVGFDDTPESRYSNPPLPTVHLPKREMGVEAARRLVHLITAPPDDPSPSYQIGLPVYLIPRASTCFNQEENHSKEPQL